ncbi:UPF0481 protein At3g47200-like isoform X1 [Malus sylvestris]|uniref:UPF0481 protein At3g47200-like isoform X1 n=1 Tax=Malus sylvestris TaxID=3752 RepID=UPI0021AB9EED|nr:UPF0481 protein At3g47200-like isoform X1 [Malus sylvestris]XP_050161129.1 UPF0481 protein At3g47200-like isoform X1 [Malus sylvestris]XP_050161130.1 UPF0481 protein At3g47200-like isoform X1 [Malus sylvestris]
MESERKINEADDSISMESIVIDNDGIVEKLKNNIAKKLLYDSPLPASCCIFRVPHQVRRQNVQAYEPDIVSIGPYHHGRCGDQFRLMENVKGWYLQRLLSHANLTLETLIKGVMDLDKPARNCYAEPLDHLNKIDFVEMMVLDGCFLIELFRKGLSILEQDENDPDDTDDPVFSVSCMLGYLQHDILLLENQLPWFVLERLYNITAVKNTTSEGNAIFLADLVEHFFRQFIGGDGTGFREILHPSPNILHILDLMRTLIVVPIENSAIENSVYQQNEAQRLIKRQRLPNVTTLSEAGIKFQKSSEMDIKFEKGLLTIPPLEIHELTGPLFRNLIAFEQCYDYDLMMTSYAVLMDNLIDTSKDIDLLCEKGILTNWLSPEDAAQFFNHLHSDTLVIRFYYGGLCDAVNQHYNTNWNKWMEKLRREYFGTPWAIISLVAAFILLVLTMLQTVYTIHQYYHPPE